jgi:pheromone shutdown protein TraB
MHSGKQSVSSTSQKIDTKKPDCYAYEMDSYTKYEHGFQKDDRFNERLRRKSGNGPAHSYTAYETDHRRSLKLSVEKRKAAERRMLSIFM